MRVRISRTFMVILVVLNVILLYKLFTNQRNKIDKTPIKVILPHRYRRILRVTREEIAKENINIEFFSNRPSAKGCKTRAFVLMVINSNPQNIERRNAIRKTWGDGTDYNTLLNTTYAWRTVFIIGRKGSEDINRKIEEESIKYGDLVLGDFIDNMKNLTFKTLLGMRWASSFCKPLFLYKGDDDVFVNAPRLFQYLTKLANGNATKLWLGRGNFKPGERIPIRDKKHKYFVSYQDFNETLFPAFCSGFSYVFSYDVLRDMLLVVKHFKKLDTIDDIYISLLARKIGVKPTHHKGFHWFNPPNPNHMFTVYEISSRIAEHDIKPDQQEKLLKMAKVGMNLFPKVY